MAESSLTSSLPPEILLQIASYLEPKELTQFQLVCKALLRIGRDRTLWLEHCFEGSSIYETVWLPRLQNNNNNNNNNTTSAAQSPTQSPIPPAQPPVLPGHGPPGQLHGPTLLQMVAQAGQGQAQPQTLTFATLQQALQQFHPPLPIAGHGSDADQASNQSDGQSSESSNEDTTARCGKQERVRIRANWDPSYPNERVSWYDEYIHRHGPTVVNWFESARRKDGHGKWANVDARGLALYRPDNPLNDPSRVFAGPDTLLAISPLDDGGICIWDVNGTKGRKGSIYAQSKPGLLFIDGPQADNNRASKRVDSGVTECVSVDNQRHRAFFAVQSHLIDVDLQTMSVVGCESFPWSITALSPAHATVPLTIATSLGIHLHDYKSRPSSPVDPTVDKVDGFSSIGAQYFYEQGLRNLFTDVPLPPYAPLAQPGPLSILHLQEPGSLVDLSDDIYVAGRFSNILHYDRRTFPAVKDSIYSGGSLCSMTSSPYPFSGLCSERRRRGQMTQDEVENSKTLPGGRTLIACGEYNSKGTLEIYGLAPNPDLSGKMEIAGHQNRHTASGSKLLSVVNHGARIAVSDAQGYVKWFERDGFTEIRRCRVGHAEGLHTPPSIYGRMEGSDDIARKILPSGPVEGGTRVNDNDVLFWTGERLGSIGFTTKPGTAPEDFLDEPEASDARAEQEKKYAEDLRRVFEQHADETRWIGPLGGGLVLGSDD